MEILMVSSFPCGHAFTAYYSDFDAIRVGHDYYAISSTMQFSQNDFPAYDIFGMTYLMQTELKINL